MSTKCIVVLGTVSVQRYIFQSNRLKEIIGASDLAKHWFDDGLIQAIKQTVSSLDRAAWKAYKDNPSISQSEVPENTDADVNIIYIGGGNAALLCKDKNIAVKVVERWSLNLLKNAPGLRVAVGYSDVSDSLYEAYNKAMDNLNHCEEALPYGAELGCLPVVQTCSTTGLPASRRSKEENRREEWISQSAGRKRERVSTAQESIRDEFEFVLKENQRFAIELEKLGGGEGQSYMAVVHADGNEMGKLLNEAVQGTNEDNDLFLHYIRSFSASVSQLSKNAFEKTMQYYQDVLPSLKGIKEHENIFPMRPIVYGGDDLTYVCDGRVGLHLTAYYLQEFAKEPIKVSGKNRHVDACAGVAIVHTKFPIAQAYLFADELCGLAKSHRRDRKKGKSSGSWLDFQIIQAGATGSVSKLRSAQYRSLKGQTLHQRPYQVPETWHNFVEILRGFQSKQWPRSRAKSLMQVLTKGPSETERFVQAAKWRDISLPSSNEAQSGWSGSDEEDCTTPYFDPLEALDFYLEDLLTTLPINIDEGEENSE